jgi:Fe-S-cluster containining protein
VGALHFDSEQRFTCQQCGRCCRRGWDIALTAGEAAAYRKADVARLYRESASDVEGAASDPFEAIAGHAGLLRIRKRADGACGFLSAENRCRIHEELGASKKPLTCRLFPFRFQPAAGQAPVSLSFGCPTVVANKGASVESQARELLALRKEWLQEHREPEVASFALVKGRSLAGTSVGALRRSLRAMLARPGPEGRPDLQANVSRMAVLFDDLTRLRVLRLEAAAFGEYLELVAGHAAQSEKPVAARSPSAFARLFFRGLVFVTLAARMQLEARSSSGLRLGLRLRLFALLAHCHGLGPAVTGCDLGAARRARAELRDPALHAIAWNYLRAQLETLGAGHRPVLDELAIAIAHLNVATLLAAMRAGQAGKTQADAADYTEALMEAVDLAHAESTRILGRLLATFAAGVESLWLFAAGPRL